MNGSITEEQLMTNLEKIWELVGKEPYNPKFYYSDAVISKSELLTIGDIYYIGGERVMLEAFNPDTGIMKVVPKPPASL